MLALTSISPANATTPLPVSGTWVNILTSVRSVKTADGNTITSYSFSETFAGDIVGVRTGTGTLITHPDGTANAHNCGTFVGTILGVSGTLYQCVNVQGTLASFTTNYGQNDGTGGLAGGHGEGTAVGGATSPTTFAGTYSGQFDFGR
jgi:hypothetical protein